MNATATELTVQLPALQGVTVMCRIAVKGAVEAGMGISIVSGATIQKELRLGTLVAVALEPPLKRAYSFVHQKQKFRLRVMEELLDFARGYCDKPHS